MLSLVAVLSDLEFNVSLRFICKVSEMKGMSSVYYASVYWHLEEEAESQPKNFKNGSKISADSVDRWPKVWLTKATEFIKNGCD